MVAGAERAGGWPLSPLCVKCTGKSGDLILFNLGHAQSLGHASAAKNSGNALKGPEADAFKIHCEVHLPDRAGHICFTSTSFVDRPWPK